MGQVFPWLIFLCPRNTNLLASWSFSLFMEDLLLLSQLKLAKTVLFQARLVSQQDKCNQQLQNLSTRRLYLFASRNDSSRFSEEYFLQDDFDGWEVFRLCWQMTTSPCPSLFFTRALSPRWITSIPKPATDRLPGSAGLTGVPPAIKRTERGLPFESLYKPQLLLTFGEFMSFFSFLSP